MKGCAVGFVNWQLIRPNRTHAADNSGHVEGGEEMRNGCSGSKMRCYEEEPWLRKLLAAAQTPRKDKGVSNEQE